MKVNINGRAIEDDRVTFTITWDGIIVVTHSTNNVNKSYWLRIFFNHKMADIRLLDDTVIVNVDTHDIDRIEYFCGDHSAEQIVDLPFEI